jgi:hypothetical protein
MVLLSQQIWRIWPAVFLHTSFAAGEYDGIHAVNYPASRYRFVLFAVVVSLSLKTSVKLDIPSVMLTVLGAPVLHRSFEPGHRWIIYQVLSSVLSSRIALEAGKYISSVQPNISPDDNATDMIGIGWAVHAGPISFVILVPWAA